MRKWLFSILSIPFIHLFFSFPAIAVPIYQYKIINIYPHDPHAYTQGLFFDDPFLYEGTGINGKSTLRRVDLKTGRPLKVLSLNSSYFGEGITIIKNRIYQLTWKSMKGFVYDKKSFRLLKEFSYNTEGWGITYDTHFLIMSDGTEHLYFLEPDSFKIRKTLSVASEARPVFYLNELEFVRGEIFANIWGQDVIARISPVTGRVLGWIDLTGLRKLLGADSQAEVLNGIAFRADRGTLLVTGKYWPKLFEIEILEK